ncbi:hypothetical protein CLV51_106156 [Chitinophaga niastensis]|uniref:Lipoprotein n=1 Tax=Chitinophaga niastensis TaxID=536980 RepID=A0A2P8HDI3_CHINA|nr:hypothetical protein [Chitinophaga niastensis]PSL44290.1 hypothetical protein CLV51_106156 [Chitinophaga niastensis]
MRYKVFIPQLLILLSILFATGCKNGGKDKVYCQTFIQRETIHDKNHKELSTKYKLLCTGHCPGKDSCEKITITYNPPLKNGLIKKQWCGCNGDTIPQACDVVLYTYNFDGRIVQTADCTAFNTCPVATDSCIQQNRDIGTDTIRSADHKDSLYIYHTQISCECMNRK